MNKLLTGIIAIVIVAAAGVAAFTLLNNNSNDSDSYSTAELSDLELMVFGNANNDLTINTEDRGLIQDIIDGKVTDWESKYPLADVNCDGKVDSSDIDLVNKIIKRESTDVYVYAYDPSEATPTTHTGVKVSYPLTNLAVSGLNTANSILYTNAGSLVKAHAIHQGVYANAMSSLGGTSILDADSNTDWTTFGNIDSENHIGAFIIENTSYSGFFNDDVSKEKLANIPTLVMAASGPNTQASCSLTIGFLCGSSTENTGLKFAELSKQALDSITNATSAIADADKKSAIIATMYICIYNNSNVAQDNITNAGGIPYYKTNSEFAKTYNTSGVSPMSVNKEALSNYTDADAYISIRTSDFLIDSAGNSTKTKADVAVSNWEYNFMNVSTPLQFYGEVLDKTVFINNLLPGVLKAAYIAQVLYSDSLGADFGTKLAQSFIDEGFAPFQGQTTDSILGIITYADYTAAKSS